MSDDDFDAEPDQAEEAIEFDDDEPEAMTGSAVPWTPVTEADPEPEPEVEPEPPAAIAPGPGFPITIQLDDQGNGSTHVGVFARDIASVEIDGIPSECVWAGDHPSAVGIAVIEVRGAPTRLKPVSGIVVTR